MRNGEVQHLDEWVSEVLKRDPSRCVATDVHSKWTAGVLEAGASRVAAGVNACGVGPGDFVGVCIPRSCELIAAILGILKAGAAYLPLDPDYPSGRLADMVSDSGVRLVLTVAETSGRLDGVAEWRVDREIPAGACGAGAIRARSGDDPAYLIYTSGSTGRPKGVVVPHRAILASLRWLAGAFDFAPGEAVLHRAPISFDFSVWEIFFPLVAGGRLVLPAPGAQRDPQALADWMERESVAWAFFVPSLLRSFLEATPGRVFPALRHVFCSGEPLTVEIAGAFRRRLGARLHNVYGPTEAAVEVMHWEIPAEVPGDAIPVGRPFPGVVVRLLDGDLREVPEGETGEICLGGVQLATGYHGQPELTAERFFFAGECSERLYRTGDLGVRRPDGNYLCLGRIDRQLKVRGFRVEPGEIEACLESHPAVRQAAVVLRRGRAEPRLVAYVVGEASATELRRHVADRLPDHMVPAQVVGMAELPVNESGKLDRDRLPDPPRAARSSALPLRRPGNERERLIAGVWAEVLDLDEVSVDDAFFEIGGDSLSLIKVHEILATRHGLPLAVADLFEFPTIAALAARGAASPSRIDAEARTANRRSGRRRPLAAAPTVR